MSLLLFIHISFIEFNCIIHILQLKACILKKIFNSKFELFMGALQSTAHLNLQQFYHKEIAMNYS